MVIPSYEAKINLTLRALQKNSKLKIRAVAKLYEVDRETLRYRRASRPARRDSRPARRDIPANSRKLTDLEENTIVQYIIELYSREFHPRLYYVEDIANRLLRECNTPPVGKYWAYNFIKR